MTRKKNSIPEFKTFQEEAEFWDTHSFTDYRDKLKDVDIVVELDKPRDETLILRLQRSFKKRLEYIARNKGLNISTLARMWLMEKAQSAKM